jgi:hypothetical protein
VADRLHGVHLAHVLLQRGGVPRSGLRLIDPHEAPLARWRHVTGRRLAIKFMLSSFWCSGSRGAVSNRLLDPFLPESNAKKQSAGTVAGALFHVKQTRYR